MMKIVVVGAGFAGCAAASAALKAGAHVTLLERMEVLGGWGHFAGRMDHRLFTIKEELRLMGGDDIFQLLDNITLHENVHFPWPEPSGTTKTIFDTSKLDSTLRHYLDGIGVEVRLQSRARNVEMDGTRIRAIILDDRTKVHGDVFVDTTSGSGPPANCRRYGNGCVMCFHRCTAFGNRVSIAAKAGVTELMGKKRDGSIGPINGGFALLKESLAPKLREKLDRQGVVWIPVPREFIAKSRQRAATITASGNIGSFYGKNIVLVDIGALVKAAAAGYTPLAELRKVHGLERAIYADPIAGTLGNAVRFMAITPRGDALDVPGVDNLFTAGEKLGIAGVGEVIATGLVAGHNAVRKAVGVEPLILPRTTMLGDYIAYVNERWCKEEGLRERFHFFSGTYSRRVKEIGLYTLDKGIIRTRIQAQGLTNLFSQIVVS